MTVDKPPIETVVGTGVGTGGLRWLVAALLTVVALLLYVLTTGGIRFTCDHRIIAIQGQAEGIGKLYPLVCVHLDTEIPVTDLHDI